MTTLNEFFSLGMDRDIETLLDPPKDFIGLELNLGVGTKSLPPNVRSIGLPEWDAETDRLPLANESVSRVWAFHFLEHIRNVEHVLWEVQRVLVPNGVFNITVPYGTCHMAVQDLNHVHFFNEDSWRHTFSNPYYNDANLQWKFWIRTNCIMGVKGENLALMTQLVKNYRS